MRHLLFAGAAIFGMAGSAVAAPVTETYDFKASLTQAPISTIAGSFNATYDTTGIGAVTLNSFFSNLPATYAPVTGAATLGSLAIGSDCNIGCTVTAGTDTFFFQFDVDPSGHVTQAFDFVYSQTGPRSIFYSSQFVVTDASLPIPEPGSAILVVLGMLGLTAARRRS